jgi:hypothetical protein
MRSDLRHVLQGAALTVLAIAVTVGPILVSPGLARATGLDPEAGRVSVTLLATLGTLATLAASVAVGYREQRHNDVAGTYRAFATEVGAGGATVVVVTAILTVGGAATTVSPLLLVLTLLSVLVSMPLVVVVATVAGVALARLPTEWRRSDAPFGQPLAVPVGAAVVACGSVVVESGLLVITSLSNDFGVPDRFSGFGGSAMETLSIYSSADSLASGLLLVGGGIAVGIFATRRYDLDESVRRCIVLVGVGSLVGTTVAPVILSVLTDSTLAGAFGAGSRWLVAWAASITSAFVETGLVVTLAAVAGLGIGVFEHERGRGGPTAAPADAPDGEAAPRDEGDIPDDDGRSELSSADETVR